MTPGHSPNGGSPHPSNGGPVAPPGGYGPSGGYYDASPDEVDLHSLIATLRRQWWVVAAVAVGIVVVVAAYTLLQEPEFETSSVVLVETRNARGGGGGAMDEVLSFTRGNRSLNNEVAILRESVPLAERVAVRLLDEYNGPLTLANGDGGGPAVGHVGRSILYGRVRFAPVSNDADLLMITARSTDPREAAVLANLYAEEYALRSQEASRASVVSSRTFLEEQVAQQRRQLDTIESELQEFVSREGAVALDSDAQRTVTQLSMLDTELEQTRIDLDIERTTLRSREAELERVQPGLAQRIASGVDAEMSAINRQIADLELEAAPYYATDPSLRGNEESVPELARTVRNIRQLRDRLTELGDQYIAEVMAVGGVDGSGGGTGLNYFTQLQRDVIQQRILIQGMEAREQALRQRLAGHEGRLRDIPRQTIQLAQLQRQRQAVTETYLFLVNKLQEARVAEQSQLGYVQVIRRADVPGSPVRPRTRRNLMLGILLGLMGGVGAALLRSTLDRKVREPDDLKAHDFTVLGTVPDLGELLQKNFDGKDRVTITSGEVDAVVAAGLHPLSPFSEAMRRLRTSIRFSIPDRTLRTILVTSAGPAEGKTTAAVNLAVSMAQAGRRTLLVDGDMRRSTVHERLGLRRQHGLTELLFQGGRPDWEQYRCRLDAHWDSFDTTAEDLFVVTAGKSVPNPAELLGSNRMRELLAEMEEKFDVVIIDSPPVLAVSDAVVLAGLCDAVVLMAVAGRSDLRALESVREQLGLSQTPLLGVVLNRYRPQTGYGYQYAYSYGYGYGKGYGTTAHFAGSGDGSPGVPTSTP